MLDTPTVQEKGTLICNVTQHYRYNTYSYETDMNYIMGWVGPSGLSLSQLFSLNAQYGFNRLLILGSGKSLSALGRDLPESPDPFSLV